MRQTLDNRRQELTLPPYTVEEAHEKLVKLPRAEADIQETPLGLDGFSFHTGPKVNQSERRA